jgi:ADP-ribose pyrophosphatase YjhB (NUDIX family)
VCYRTGKRGIEFLLVQTRGERWTFPKGSTEPGLTHAQAAAIEAFEEAGVHGRIEEASFARYTLSTRHIHAHLCEVLRLEAPQEFGRAPTWFPAKKAKRSLREGRRAEDAASISGLVDAAMARIAEQQSSAGRRRVSADALQKVEFEVGRQAQLQTALVRYVRREGAVEVRDGRRGKVLQLSAPFAGSRLP